MGDPLHRRTLLSQLAVGVSALGAGCSTALSPGATPQSSPTTSPPRPSPTTDSTTATRTTIEQTTTTQTLSMGETATSANGTSVTIAEPRIRRIIFTPDAGSFGHSYPSGNTNSQFLVVAVSAREADVTSLRLAPVLDGSERESQTYRHSVSPENSGLLGFRVPIAEAQRGAIEWRPSSDERFRWTLPESVVTNLRNSPRFVVKRFTVSEGIQRGDPFTATLEVTNSGDRDGRFLAVVIDQGPSSLPFVHQFTVSVPQDETVTRTVSGRAVEGERSSVTAILDWGIDERMASFSVVK